MIFNGLKLWNFSTYFGLQWCFCAWNASRFFNGLPVFWTIHELISARNIEPRHVQELGKYKFKLHLYAFCFLLRICRRVIKVCSLVSRKWTSFLWKRACDLTAVTVKNESRIFWKTWTCFYDRSLFSRLWVSSFHEQFYSTTFCSAFKCQTWNNM